MHISSSGQVGSFLVMDLMREAALLDAEGYSIIHIEVGQPASSASTEALSRLKKKMFMDKLGYSVAVGLPKIREKVSDL